MRRPRIVTFPAALVFLLGWLQWTRAVTLFIHRTTLESYNPSIPLPYAIASAAIWGGVLISAAGGVWRLKRWGLWLTLSAVTASQAHGWIDHWLFDRSDYARLSTGFAAGTTLLTLALVWSAMWRHRKRFEN
jgi:hypothetical protein